MLPALSAALLDKHCSNNNNNNNNSDNDSNINSNINNTQESRAPKRNSSSMIFRIEQLLPTTQTSTATSTTTNSNGSGLSTHVHTSTANAKTKMQRHSNGRSGVYVSQFTPKDTCSALVASETLMSDQAASPGCSERTYCKLLPQKVLSMSAPLMRKIKLSEDVYSYNTIFELQSGQVRARLVRDAAREDELVAWFGEELTLFMGIPFLTPLNIQGNSRYMCHLCHLTFETPHPLKIHLALGCGRNNLDVLWIRLHYALKASTSADMFTPAAPLVNPTSVQHSPTQAASSSSSISPGGSPPPPMQLITQTERFSAFRPIASSSTVPTPSLLSMPPTPHISLPLGIHHSSSITTHATSLSYLPSMSSHTTSFPPLGLLQPTGTSNPLNAAAQIEAIVSNMGASKQGHLCIYCGKVYSRKYGLKIHIRTHTGFKPLKCKFCLRPFGDPSNLNKHVRLHMQTNANTSSSGTSEGYQCHICHKTLLRRKDLQRHIETRHSQSDDVVQEHTDHDKNG